MNTIEHEGIDSQWMLMALYKTPRLTFEQTCSALGISMATGYTWRSLGKFPVPMSGSPMKADLRDVAAAVDKLRADAHRRSKASAS